MMDAAAAFTDDQRATDYAVAAEIMCSDGFLQEDEHNILNNFAARGGCRIQLRSTWGSGLWRIRVQDRCVPVIPPTTHLISQVV